MDRAAIRRGARRCTRTSQSRHRHRSAISTHASVGASLVASAPPARGTRMTSAGRLLCRRPLPEGGDDLPSSLHPVLRRVYRARQVHTATELDCTLDRLLSPTQLLGMEQAVTLLEQALRAQRRILVVADFDADGATSCSVVVRALKLMGAQNVDYLVPNRFEYGYGLTPEIVTLATAGGAV